MKNFHFLAFILFGMFLMPGNNFACESKSERDHSATEISSNKSKKDCCDDVADHKDEKHHCCNNNCKNSKCICAPYTGVFLAFSEIALQARNYDFFKENQKFNHPETSTSSGYTFLFLKPKIG